MLADESQDLEATPHPDLGPCDPPKCAILREADHRVANNLAQLVGMISLRLAAVSRDTDAPTKDGVRHLLRSIQSGIMAASRLHRLLAANGSQAPIDLGAYLHELCAPVSDLSGTPSLVEDFAQGCLVSAETVLPVGQIVVEAVTNAVKYGHRTTVSQPIRLACRHGPRGRVLVEIADGGPGLSHGIDPAAHGGLGMSVMTALAAKIGAALAFDSSETGLRIGLDIPMARHRGV